MADFSATRWRTLLQRELREYRVSLLWTPLLAGGLLALLILASSRVANQLSEFGAALFEAFSQMEEAGHMSLGAALGAVGSDSARAAVQAQDSLSGLHLLFYGVHALMLMALLLVSFNYLQGCLFTDRKDGSILFWKSMPVAAWEEVLAKLAVATVLAPVLFLAASWVAQLALLFTLSRLAAEATSGLDLLLANLSLSRLFADQAVGWMLTALWAAPVYAWVLLASAAARRSPALMAIAPLLGLVVLEALLLGSRYLIARVWVHMPRLTPDDVGVGGYLHDERWVSPGLFGLFAGVVVAGCLLWACVWLRQHRWET
ncbi:MAG: hypothetical protein NWQ24_12905 [Haliea sp.]|nr:hypothetical protein [Haliea sp.]